MKPHTHAGPTPAKRLSSIRYRSKRKRLSIIRIINVVGLMTVCGCVPPVKKATQTTRRYAHHEPTIRSSEITQHELSEVEKDKLFRGFERWRAVEGQVGSQGKQQGQSARAVGDAEVPDE
jgi:hypothetical protein